MRTKDQRPKSKRRQIQPKRAIGRPTFAVTDDLRRKVARLVGLRMTHVNIAQSIGCSVMTLKRHFGEELRLGASRNRAALIDTIFETAKRGKVQAMILLCNMATGKPLDGRRKPLKLGVKAQRLADAERIMQPDTWLGPSSPPKLVINNDEEK